MQLGWELAGNCQCNKGREMCLTEIQKESKAHFVGKFILGLLWASGSQHICCLCIARMLRSYALCALNFVNLFSTEYNLIQKAVAGQNVLSRASMFGEDWLVPWESGSPITAELNLFHLDILRNNNLEHLVPKYLYGLLLGVTISNTVCTF